MNKEQILSDTTCLIDMARTMNDLSKFNYTDCLSAVQFAALISAMDRIEDRLYRLECSLAGDRP